MSDLKAEWWASDIEMLERYKRLLGDASSEQIRTWISGRVESIRAEMTKRYGATAMKGL